jgi:hypothetical protein
MPNRITPCVVFLLASFTIVAQCGEARADAASTTSAHFRAEDDREKRDAIAFVTDVRHREFRARALRFRTSRIDRGGSPNVPSVNGLKASDNTTLRIVDGKGQTLTLSEALARAGADDLADRQRLALGLSWFTSPPVLLLGLMPMLLVSTFASSLLLFIGPTAVLFGVLPVFAIQGAASLVLLGGLSLWGLSFVTRRTLAVDEGHARLVIVEHNRRIAREVGLREDEIPSAYLANVARR